MKTLLENIVKECLENNLKVSTETIDGEIAYRVEGFSKSGNALIYVGEDAITCETRYGQKDNIITFNDLVLVAKSWYENYRDRTPFEKPEPEWLPLLSKVYNSKHNPLSVKLEDLSDLPF